MVKKRTNIFLIVLLALLLILEIILVKNNYFATIDDFIYHHISKLINHVNTAIFKFFSFFGSEIFIILFCLLILIFSRKKSRGVGFVFILLLSVLFNQGLKLIIARDRPTINQLVSESNYSFPSGHTMLITVIVALFIFYLWQEKKGSKVKKIILTSILVLFALLVMLSRIYLGVHYFSDILGGITASLLLLSIVYYYYTFKHKVPYFPKNKK